MQDVFEKIKERLEKTRYSDIYGGWETMRIDKAIEIVNQVAEEYGKDINVPGDDGCCEWIKYDYRTIAPKNHDAKNPYWRIPEDMSKLRFCPYCGKEIKVME